jgi:nucleotide-binding universal stress UspA family protein
MIDLRMAYPDVRVQVDVVHGQAAFALVDRSAEADLLLISRPAHGGFVHFLGATARAVIRDATCPIEVVPPIDETLHLEHLEHLDGTAVSVP